MSTAAMAVIVTAPLPPVHAFVEVMPGVLDAARVPADEQRDDMLGKIGGNGQLAAVEGRIAEARQRRLRSRS